MLLPPVCPLPCMQLRTETDVISVVFYLLVIRLIKYVQLAPKLGPQLLSVILTISDGAVVLFIVVMVVLILAFSVAHHVAFGGESAYFGSVLVSFMQLFSMTTAQQVSRTGPVARRKRLRCAQPPTTLAPITACSSKSSAKRQHVPSRPSTSWAGEHIIGCTVCAQHWLGSTSTPFTLPRHTLQGSDFAPASEHLHWCVETVPMVSCKHVRPCGHSSPPPDRR